MGSGSGHLHVIPFNRKIHLSLTILHGPCFQNPLVNIFGALDHALGEIEAAPFDARLLGRR